MKEIFNIFRYISWVWNHTFGYRSSRIIVGDTQEKEGAESN